MGNHSEDFWVIILIFGGIFIVGLAALLIFNGLGELLERIVIGVLSFAGGYFAGRKTN